MVGVVGFEPTPFLMCRIYSPVPVRHPSSTPIILVVVDGLEPPTAHQSSAYERYKLSALPLSYTTKLGK